MNFPKRLNQSRRWNSSFDVVLDSVLLLNFQGEPSAEDSSWKGEKANADDGQNARDELR